ncbi:ABC transporter substrate-binding protein [Pusillimonas noertemannii]|uniref:Amino acid/amide ABC transporter substrate-binding protein (HAAT family) n=1 Tax=Pusillimonas noertemannii TaxID=305977 RepID=A0A2U1CQQ1_9BURK|nr:ABC transporter substrate-binding protein [Pusillimonas noertemannii]NYT67543.1 ABC transporter substrate-binding protein [Pusillimonas noertemannii]PVY68217.1 amino acid/amide ABC transporter substrate-binding protein (HAAT family) [Pusillimonas noertemannii]TFL12289.1 ABC transporter substrate-binding protein [Pusillimonas noertemannii]
MKTINKWTYVLCLASVFGMSGALAQSDPIRIGLPVPLTGPYGAEAKDQVRNAEIAVKEFNEAGGLDGRMAELLVRDDKLNPGEAATRALDLIEKDHANFIVGGLSASTQLSTNNVTKQRKVIYISISQSDAINEAADMSRYTFHEALNPHMTTQALGRHLFKEGMRIAFLTADYAYGHEMARGFTTVAEEVGAKIVGEVRHPLGTSDYSVFLPRLAALKPDILIFNNFGRDNQISIQQAGQFGLKANTKFVTPVLLYTARQAAGDKVYEGVTGATSYYWELQNQYDTAKALNERYKKEHGSYPSDYGALAYGAVKSLLMAVKQAGTTDTEKVVDALASLKYDTYKGPEYYRGCDHQAVQSVLIIESKAAPADNPDDVFKIVKEVAPTEDILRSCEQLGFK